jgi:hypothetical protein
MSIMRAVLSTTSTMTARAVVLFAGRFAAVQFALVRFALVRFAFIAAVAIAGLTAGAAAAFAAPPDARPAKLSFNRDIRPILSDNCFRCHGPDEGTREAGLRLDRREHAVRAGESGKPAIVPKAVADSEALRRIVSTDADLRMPPPTSGKSLTPAQIDVLQRWVAEGAEYEGHWAFMPVERPAPPAVNRQGWVRNDVDRFLLARLEREQLEPAPEAALPILLRRVALDLTGIPPTPREIDAVLADPSRDAYERFVDRLLDSPRYGERMALQWLDFARFADSNGFQVDSSRQMWPWRDWVIDAFNRNVPFDQFTIEQLAGDLLPNATPQQILATGFNRNHRLNGEGGIIAEEWRVETVIDRVETTGMTWLGLTLNCCRCHDHKYDPISQREFYQFFSFFNNVAESGTLQGESRNTDPVLAVPTPDLARRIAEQETRIAAAEKQVADASAKLPALIAAWEPGFRDQLKDRADAWIGLEPTMVKSLGGATLARQPDGSYLASGVNPENDTYEISAPIPAGGFSGLLLETFPDPSLPNQSLGRFPNGNYVLSRVEAEISGPGLAEPLRGVFNKAVASYSQMGWEIENTVRGNRQRGWAVDGNDPTKRLPRRAMFLLETPLTAPANATLTVRLRHESLGQHGIGRFRLSRTTLAPGTVSLEGSTFPATLATILATEAASRTPAQRLELEKFYRANVDSPVRAAEVAVAAAKKALADLRAAMPNAMVMKELDKPRDAFILVRGQYDKRGDAVTAGLPAVLPSLPAGQPLNRLGLARWIVDPNHPLTARVWVNRAWERFFGTGLVKTTENFGSQAEFPSHPELLDWLAAEFMRPTVSPAVSGRPAQPWDMKAFQKLLVTSAAYRQSSRVTPELAQRDPENRLLARGPRFRLPAELVRDQALAVSGLLVEKVGGPSVRPYMPDGVWDETSRYGDLRNYKNDDGEGLYRRTLYTVWKRTAAPPTMLLFDAPNREICTVKRSRTNTPLQALALLNEVTYVEAARKLGERMIADGGATVASRLAYGFRLAVGRPPEPDETRVLVEGLEVDRQRLRAAGDAPTRLIAFGQSKPPANIDASELAAYTLAANVLLNLDEVVTRE